MTFTAELYIADNLYKTIAIEDIRQEIIIVGCPRMPVSRFDFNNPMTVEMSKMIFDLTRRTGQFTLRYDFRMATGRVNTYSDSQIFFESEPDEPDDNVNLDKLKQKFRSREKMTELLLRYYRS